MLKHSASNNHQKKSQFQRPKYEVADVFRRYGEDFIESHPFISKQQFKVMHAIANCRTEQMGGHIDVCQSCGTERPSYNSCRNRHCPKCQGLEKERWIDARQAELLPIEYFHWVFTLPHCINGLINQGNASLIYSLLFRVANETLQAFALKKWDAEIGVTMVLHTWGQTMNQHVHVHCIVTGGGLKKDKSGFICSPYHYLFPVKAVQKKYQGRFIAALLSAYEQNDLNFSKEMTDSDYYMDQLLSDMRRYEWVVYAKQSFSNPDAVIKYLGRYTHKIALSNHRIESISDDGNVTFRYKDNRAGGESKKLTVTALKFIALFLQHVFPFRFMRIRHYGLLACGHRASKLNIARVLLGLPKVVAIVRQNCADYLLSKFDQNIFLCQHCKTGVLEFERSVKEPFRQRI